MFPFGVIMRHWDFFIIILEKKKNEKEKSPSSLNIGCCFETKLPILKLEAHLFFGIPQLKTNISTLLKGRLSMTFSVKPSGVCK